MSENTRPPNGDSGAPKQGAAPSAFDEDRTIIAPMPKPEAAAPPQGTPGAGPQNQAPVEDDGDRTLLVPMPADFDSDRTIIGGQIPPAVPPNAPQDEGSTYSPMAPQAPSPVPAPQDAETQASVAPPVPASTFTNSINTRAEPPPLAEPLRKLEPGSVINNMYRVDERIGHGGMGRVFRGTEISTGEAVAIKVILPEMAEDPRVGQMFRREARTLRQLHHDAIVRYFAYVPPDTNFNLHALVMGFIEGTKLSDHITNGGALTEAEVCRMCLRLADGLRRAHRIGVIHRDLSPDNVMLPGGEIERAVLIDFGISRSSKVRDVTIGNEFAGKLKYVSPEQLGAYGGDAGPESDVYSFALLMIATLTGQALAMGDTIVEAVQKRQAVPDLSTVPSTFQSLLYQMLQPDPDQRMPSMDKVIEALISIQRGGAGDPGASPTTAPVTLTSSHVVPGLQAAPRANPQGGGFATSAPGTLSAQVDSGAVAPPKKSGLGLGVVLLLVAGLIGAGGWYATTQMNGGPGGLGASDPMARVEGTVQTYLAQSAPDEGCVYATVRGQGGFAGRIEGFASDAGRLPTGQDWPTELGPRPETVHRAVQQSQCAALDLARQFQGTTGPAVEVALDAEVVSRSEGVVGTVYGVDERQNWLGLVAPNGRVFSLMSQLEDPIGTQRQFSFRLPSATPGVYMLIVTASQDALVRAGAMKDGSAAADILPLFASELAGAGAPAVDVGLVEITR